MNSRTRVLLIALLVAQMVFQGCSENVNSVVNKLSGSTLDFDWTKQTVTSDTIIDGIDFHAPLKIVVSVDSSLCESCLARYLRACSQYMEQFDNDSVMLICIIEPCQVHGIQDTLKGIDLSGVSVVVDVDKNYRKKNSIERYNRLFASFLLDSDNRIVVVGDPIRSNSIRELFDEQIEVLVNNKGKMSGKRIGRWGR